MSIKRIKAKAKSAAPYAKRYIHLLTDKDTRVEKWR